MTVSRYISPHDMREEIIIRFSEEIIRGAWESRYAEELLAKTDASADTTVIHRDGSISGAIPLTFRRDLGSGGYGL